MGVFIPEGFGTASVRMQIPGSAGPAFNVFGLEREGTLTALQTAEQWGDAINNAGTPWTSASDVVLADQVEVRLKIGGEIHIAAVALTLSPTGTENILPPSNCYLFKKLSGFAGRSNRGRFYMPGVSENAVDDGGAIEAGVFANVQGWADTFLSALGSLGQEMVILHENPALTPRVVTSLVLDARIGTQRGRIR